MLHIVFTKLFVTTSPPRPAQTKTFLYILNAPFPPFLPPLPLRPLPLPSQKMKRKEKKRKKREKRARLRNYVRGDKFH